MTAADLEPHYDRFEYLLGTSGKAGNLKGSKIAGRQSVRGPALARLPDAADEGALRLGAMFRKAADRASATTRSRSRRRT